VYLSVMSEHVRVIKIRDSHMLSMCVRKDGGRMCVCRRLAVGVAPPRKEKTLQAYASSGSFPELQSCSGFTYSHYRHGHIS
jgi:hypothetical protein